ncbi:HNH endonuclease [Agrobacterium tumefaciens]|nr:HNH endonuclease [Agrobacterium tumefaciens]
MAEWPYSTAAWQRLRIAKLSQTPVCEACRMLGRIEIAEVVDHVKAIASGGDPFPPLEGLMSLCAPCHNSKTNAKDRRNATTGRSSGHRRALKGFDVDGNPIDPEWWNDA